MEIFSAYHTTGGAMLFAGGLALLQLLVADVAGMKVPHIPGAPIEPNHKSFLFRASRSLGNMNESISIFILFCISGIVLMADPVWLGRFALGYVGARALYMLCYWFNIKLARSAFFGISLVALILMGATVVLGLKH